MFIRVDPAPDRQVSISSFDDRAAIEKGRLMAARAIAGDPQKRRELENQWGIETMRQRYPEAYRSGFGSLLDKIAHLW